MTIYDWLGVYVLLGIAWALREFFTLLKQLNTLLKDEPFTLYAETDKDAEEITEATSEIKKFIEDTRVVNPFVTNIITFTALTLAAVWSGVIWPGGLYSMLRSRKTVAINKRK